MPVVIGGDNLPSPVQIGLTDLTNIGGGAVAPLAPPVPAPLFVVYLPKILKTKFELNDLSVAVMPEPGGPGGPLAPPIFGRSVNPIRTGEGRLSPPITTGPLNVFHLPASLLLSKVRRRFFQILWPSQNIRQ